MSIVRWSAGGGLFWPPVPVVQIRSMGWRSGSGYPRQATMPEGVGRGGWTISATWPTVQGGSTRPAWAV
eukprot:5880068-Pyramimonas_sp.AAC.1